MKGEEKRAKLLFLETLTGYKIHILVEKKVLLKAENYREKNLKKKKLMQSYPPMAGLYVQAKPLYTPYSPNWYERYIFRDHKLVHKYRADNTYRVPAVFATTVNKLLFSWNKASSTEQQSFFGKVPQFFVTSMRPYEPYHRGSSSKLQKQQASIAPWLKFIQQEFGALVSGLEEQYLRHLAPADLLNLHSALNLADLKPLLPAANPLANLVPFLNAADYSWEGRNYLYASPWGYLKIFEGFIAAARVRDFLGELQAEAGDKYLATTYENQHSLRGIPNGPIEALACSHRLLGFVLYNTCRQQYSLLTGLDDRVYLEGAGWTTALELEKLRLSNLAGIKVKSNSSKFRLQLEQQAFLLMLSVTIIDSSNNAVVEKMWPRPKPKNLRRR